jgi:hypothetical protein
MSTGSSSVFRDSTRSAINVSAWQHPALVTLSRYQFRAKIAKATKSFRSPRRIVLSITAVVLAVLWLGQAVAGILLRSAADPQKLAIWIPFSLLLYTVFHFVKTACKTPVEPFEWTPAELLILKSSPITRRQLIFYRLRGYLTSIVAKAMCFTLVMIPDLQCLSAGFLGMVCGLAIVDLTRALLEVLVYGMSKRERLCFRAVVVAIAVAFLSIAFAKTVAAPNFAASVNSPAALVFVQKFYMSLMAMTQNPIGRIIVAPFAFVGSVVLAPSLDGTFLAKLLVVVSSLALGILALIKLDAFVLARVQKREVQNCDELRNPSPALVKQQEKVKHSSKVPTRLRGIGSIAWYQSLGAIHYRSTIAIALLVPTLLCCIPLLSQQSPMVTLLNVVGGIVFYSFLLLPPALMLDYRRDVRRLSVWKALPITPMSVTMGQLIVPVALTSLFQLAVLVITAVLSPISWTTIALTWPLLIPMNVFIFGLENLIFLIHPIRRNQEGMEVFLRTILTFTAKGLLFAVGAGIALGWAFATTKLCTYLPYPEWSGKILFGGGVWVFTTGMAAVSVWWLSKLFDRLDPSQDLPAAS